jgi:4'-phosphopantetheinyl transferase
MGCCFHAFQSGPVRVQVLGLPTDPEPWLALLEPLASADRRRRAARFRFRADALRCLAAEGLLRHALHEVHGLDPANLVFQLGANGKPGLASHPGIHFNLSHSGGWVLCALDGHPVGIDVEEEGTRTHLPAEGIMAPEELHCYRSLGPLEARAYFFRLWTLKESLLKALGTGFSLDPREVRLQGEADGITAIQAQEPLAGWVLAELPMPGGIRAALCSRALVSSD